MSVTYREALGRALRDAMTADERVLLLGQDIGAHGGAYGVTAGLLEAFGPERVRDAPSAEAALVGLGIGAALAGLRPVVEITTAAFLPLAFDQVVHQLAAAGPMSGGALRAPLVLRVPQGAGARLGPVHSANVEGLLHHVPGLRVLAPASVADAYGMLRWAATETDEPTVVLEHVQLYNSTGEHVGVVDDVARAAVRRAGGDVTLIAASRMVGEALAAAAVLADEHGVEATVVDLRTLRPLDLETVATAVRGANGRAVIAEEGWPHGGVGATLAAALGGRVVRVSGADRHVPYAATLEAAALPDAGAIVAAALPLAQVRDRRALGAPDHTMSIEVALASLDRGSPIADQVAARCADLLSGFGECAIVAPEEPLVLLGENRRASARRPALTLTLGPVIARPSARDGAVTVHRFATLTLALASGLASAGDATELLAALRERLAAPAE
ncbi:alpha-ketoacid dehydrogenase subunit beta [Conexibacter woesei]|uniref:alpha-ketoacid dehydrogenase subunit beta n=1 Tax=Conexibacter woesei TaxID=191495 RepID=UPI0004055E1D|nr:transketolase C-terminal domain-containing protein [Conexibacter woesei]